MATRRSAAGRTAGGGSSLTLDRVIEGPDACRVSTTVLTKEFQTCILKTFGCGDG